MKNIAIKLVEVMGECAYIAKNGTNDYHKYKYVTAEDVVSKVNNALSKQGLCTLVKPTLLSIEQVTNLKGNIEHLATVQIAIQLIDSVSGEVMEISGIGSGQDSGDKAVMKAQTAAIKYAYMLSFAIATGDDPEADSKTDKFNVCKVNSEGSAKSVNNANISNNVAHDNSCSECSASVSNKVSAFSTKKFGQVLCMKCQKNKNVAA